jgi:hypothetical protein
VETTLDGYEPFVSLLAVLGEPTRDNRVLAADGAFTMPVDGPMRLPSRDPARPHDSTVIGVLVALWRRGDMLYAVGVASADAAAGLNDGTLALGADMACLDYERDAESGQLLIKKAEVRGAVVKMAEEFAWS